MYTRTAETRCSGYIINNIITQSTNTVKGNKDERQQKFTL